MRALTTELANFREPLSPSQTRLRSDHCRAMLTPEEFQQISTQIPYIDSLGTAARADMGPKRRRHL